MVEYLSVEKEAWGGEGESWASRRRAAEHIRSTEKVYLLDVVRDVILDHQQDPFTLYEANKCGVQKTGSLEVG